MRITITTLALLASTALAQSTIPADPPPQWWKGNLHTHTFWSDGNDFPEMVTQWYADNGYNFLALSDHNTLSTGQRWMGIDTINKRSQQSAYPRYLERFGQSWVETRNNPDTNSIEVRLKPFTEFRALVEQHSKFILLQSEEITDSFERRPIHINATNIARLIEPKHGSSVEDTIRRNLQAINAHAKKHSREILPHLNHPNFGFGITAEDIAPVLEEQFFEVFNGHSGVNNAGDDTHASTERIWDIVNTIRITELKAPPIFAIATDDSHSYHGNSTVSIPGRGWVMVKAKHLTPESLIRAMKAGDFYASTGIILDTISFDTPNNTLNISIIPQEGESYTTRFIGTLRNADLTSQPITDAQGNPITATRRYSPDIGRILAEVQGTRPTYQFTGQELYIRAVIVSDAPPERPTHENLKKHAWTQPIQPSKHAQ